MSKKILALLLVLALLMPVIPQPARAAELTPVVISIVPESTAFTGVVYTDGSDLYFSGRDLERITDFSYEPYDSGDWFERGSKSILIQHSGATDGSVTYDVAYKSGSVFSTVFRGKIPIKKVGEELYFSGSTLLPWLNVTVAEEYGKLIIVSDEYSFWDIYDELDLDKYDFDYKDLLHQYSSDSKVVKAMNYMDNSIGQTFQEAINYEDKYGGSAEDYYDLFSWLLLDTAHNDYLADTIHEYATVSPEIATYFNDSLDGIFTAFKFFNDGMLYASHYSAFTAQHADRLILIDAIINDRYKELSYTDQMIEGAELAQESYTSWWKGLLNTYVMNADEYLVDAIQGALVDHPLAEAILLAMDISTKEIQNLNDRIDLMAPLFNMYATCKLNYDAHGSWKPGELEQARCCSIISLFGAAENFRTLSTYSDKHKLYDLATKYRLLAEECDRWISRLTACTLSQVNDSSGYLDDSGIWHSGKELYTQKLLDIFASVTTYTAPAEGLEIVEYGMFAAYAEELPLVEPTWQIMHPSDGSTPFYLLMATMEHDGAVVYFQYDMEVSDLSCCVYHLTEEEDWQGDNPCLTDVTVSGSAPTLLQRLDSYLEQRGHLHSAHTVDLDSDGDEDRVYILPRAMNLWIDRTDIRLYEPLSRDYFFPEDDRITLVVAETEESGIRLRIMRADHSGGFALLARMDSTTLVLGNIPYTYQRSGDPFVTETDYLLESCIATYRTIMETYMSSYANPGTTEDGGNTWLCASQLSEGLSMVFDFVSDYEDPNATPVFVRIEDYATSPGTSSRAALCPGVKMGMTYNQVAKALDLTEPVAIPGDYDYAGYVAYSNAMGCALELHFSGSNLDDAILTLVLVQPLG